MASADELHITQPALSNHIKILEDEIGVVLIERSKGKQSSLTKAGQIFLNGTGKILSLLDTVVEECRDANRAKLQQLLLQLPFQINDISIVLMEEVKRFEKSHPEIEVIIKSGNLEHNPFNEMLNGDIDCCLCSIFNNGSPENSSDDHVILPVCQEEIVAWIDCGNPLSNQEFLTPDDLTELSIPLYNYSRQNMSNGWLNSIFGNRVVPEHSVRYAESFDAFILNECNKDDVLILPENYTKYPTFFARKDRVMRRFNPPVHITLQLAFRKDDANPASVSFKEFIQRTLAI
jgi:DNA-binding transcriptional LysR family regulator